MKKLLSPQYISSYFTELGLVLRAGIPLSDGIYSIAGGDQNDAAPAPAVRTRVPRGEERRYRDALREICSAMDGGAELSAAMRACGAFPDYACELIEVGTRTGYLEAAMFSLAEYYERQARLRENIRSAVMYPCVLLAVIVFVVAALVIGVLPVFLRVFGQLGIEVPGYVAAVTGVASAAGCAAAGIFALALLAAAAASVMRRFPRGSAALTKLRLALTRNWRVSRRIATARVAAAMSMTVSGGLNPEDGLELASRMSGNAAVSEAVEKCRELAGQGEGIADSAAKAGLFSPYYCRLLAVGVRTGSVETAMAELARRTDENAADTLDRIVAGIEPAMVAALSAVVGLILVSVMLPLLNVLSAL